MWVVLSEATGQRATGVNALVNILLAAVKSTREQLPGHEKHVEVGEGTLAGGRGQASISHGSVSGTPTCTTDVWADGRVAERGARGAIHLHAANIAVDLPRDTYARLSGHLTPFRLLFSRDARTQPDAVQPEADGVEFRGEIHRYTADKKQAFGRCERP